ncbi:hypothetical protein BJX70DRAFT_110041 [Aspergillus crustosus]
MRTEGCFRFCGPCMLAMRERGSIYYYHNVAGKAWIHAKALCQITQVLKIFRVCHNNMSYARFLTWCLVCPAIDRLCTPSSRLLLICQGYILVIGTDCWLGSHPRRRSMNHSRSWLVQC